MLEQPWRRCVPEAALRGERGLAYDPQFVDRGVDVLDEVQFEGEQDRKAWGEEGSEVGPGELNTGGSGVLSAARDKGGGGGGSGAGDTDDGDDDEDEDGTPSSSQRLGKTLGSALETEVENLGGFAIARLHDGYRIARVKPLVEGAAAASLPPVGEVLEVRGVGSGLVQVASSRTGGAWPAAKTASWRHIFLPSIAKQEGESTPRGGQREKHAAHARHCSLRLRGAEAKEFDCAPAAFGAPPPPAVGAGRARALDAVLALDAAHLCCEAPAEGARPYAGRALVVMRGGCMFEQKARAAEASGAALLVVINVPSAKHAALGDDGSDNVKAYREYAQQEVFYMEAKDATGGPSSPAAERAAPAAAPSIPTVMVSHASGKELLLALDRSATALRLTVAMRECSENQQRALAAQDSNLPRRASAAPGYVSVAGPGPWGIVLERHKDKKEWQMYITKQTATES